jgi:glycerophosphoryl diester phosphodiesterase
MLDRVTIQSFDWGALMRMGEVEPRLPLVALVVPNLLEVEQPGASPLDGDGRSSTNVPRCPP